MKISWPLHNNFDVKLVRLLLTSVIWYHVRVLCIYFWSLFQRTIKHRNPLWSFLSASTCYRLLFHLCTKSYNYPLSRLITSRLLLINSEWNNKIPTMLHHQQHSNWKRTWVGLQLSRHLNACLPALACPACRNQLDGLFFFKFHLLIKSLHVCFPVLIFDFTIHGLAFLLFVLHFTLINYDWLGLRGC